MVKFCTFGLLFLASLAFTACGGNSSGSTTAVTPPPASYTIGGMVSDLSGTGLVLQDNGGDNLPVGSSGNFTFSSPVARGGSYNVTVLTQPSSPTQTCVVTSGSGNANANVTGVQVTCTTITFTIGGSVSGLSGTGLVLQNNGSNDLTISANGAFTFNAPVDGGGTYNVTVLTDPSNPTQTCMVTNGSGTANADVTSVQVACSSGATNQWTWMSGANTVDQLGMYGTQGMPGPANVPGSRDSGVSWIDATGNFWLFGGFGEDGAGTIFVLNDLWKYDAAEWTWIGGSNITGQPGTYGTQGMPAPANVPGARKGAVRWTDAAGNFWLFGGLNPSGPPASEFNDLWEYSAGEWTWVSGADTPNQIGAYGTKGTSAPANVPGGRGSAVSWIDSGGNLWLFGGDGYDSTGTFGLLNDLWKYSAGEWTWMSGSNLGGQSGTYGTRGTAAPSNVPGARRLAVSWADAAGNLWLFGGDGLDSTVMAGELNDLWMYSAGQWTWVSGSNTRNQLGAYGIRGAPSPNNVPGARDSALSLADAAGNLWLFGGEGYDSTGLLAGLNDLWKYSAGEWTWVSGSNTGSQPGSYGTQGTTAPSNVPGGRNSPVGWVDAAGNLWLLGGVGLDSNGAAGELDDLWKYVP